MGKHRIIRPGDRFADLEIVADAGLRVYCGEKGRHWLCRCLLCGREIVVPQKNLGKAQKNCGCARRNPRKELPAGTRFGRLTVLEPVPAKTPGEPLRYRLRCDCGRETLATRSNLMAGDVRSCGCLHDELFRKRSADFRRSDQADGTTRTHMAHLDTVYASNTSGIRGVSWHRGKQKWQARIAYKGKTYALGYYDDIAEAGEAVRQARGRIQEDFESKEALNMKTYYLPKDGIDPDTIYGGEPVVCISEKEIARLSREWDTDLMEQMRPATADEIEQLGVYDD